MSRRVERAFIGLGSNLGDRQRYLDAACRGLRETPGIAKVCLSPLYETDPIGPPPQGPYLNAVAEIDTTLAPQELLERLQAIEEGNGRERSIPNAARTLDLDLLFYADRVLDSPTLTLPHPRCHERAFVLVPLAALAADFLHPGRGRSIRALLDAVDPSGVRPLAQQRSTPWRSSPSASPPSETG